MDGKLKVGKTMRKEANSCAVPSVGHSQPGMMR